MILLLVGILGLVVGLLSTLLGLGGGILIVPALPLLIDLGQKSTIATSLLTISMLVSVNSWSFHKKGRVIWPVAIPIGIATAISALGFSFIASRMNDGILLKVFVIRILLL